MLGKHSSTEVQLSFELVILLPHPPSKCWDYRLEVLCPAVLNHFLMTAREAILAKTWPSEQYLSVSDGLVGEGL